jgi:hypothetical protein
MWIVYLRSGPVLLTKKQYESWRGLQDEYDDYMTSLGPWPPFDVIEFLKDEYPQDVTQDELKKIRDFLASEADTLTLFHEEGEG